MNRILVTAGAVTAVVIAGLGAATVTGDSSEPLPAQSTTQADPTIAPDASQRPVSDELRRQVEEQAEQKEAIDDELNRAVREEAERLVAERS